MCRHAGWDMYLCRSSAVTLRQQCPLSRCHSRCHSATTVPVLENHSPRKRPERHPSIQPNPIQPWKTTLQVSYGPTTRRRRIYRYTQLRMQAEPKAKFKRKSLWSYSSALTLSIHMEVACVRVRCGLRVR